MLINGAWSAGLAAGIKAGKRWNKWIGWIAGVALTVMLYALFFPVIELLEGRMCQIEPLMEECD